MEYDMKLIRSLCDRYFEGETSAEEEQALREYFNRTKDVPEDLKAVKVMMCGLSEAASMTYAPRSVKPAGRAIRKIIWGSIAAAASVAVYMTLMNREIYGYDVEGNAITDPMTAMSGISYLSHLEKLEMTIDVAEMLAIEMENNETNK